MSKSKQNKLSSHLIRDTNGSGLGELPTLKFTVPNKDAPGFLRRQRAALEFAEAARDTNNINADFINRMVEFLLPFVTMPKDRKVAKEALLDMSQSQYEMFLDAITTGDTSAPAVPLAMKSVN